MKNKPAIRHQMLALRRQLSQSALLNAAQQFAEKFVQTPLFQQSQRIAFYLPFDGEVDPSLVLQAAWLQKKSCFLPVLSPHFSAESSQEHEQGSDLLRPRDGALIPSLFMEFFSYHEKDPLLRNRYGILQPDPSKSEKCSPENLDLVLVPLVAYDDQHNRLGMGGGYYDRSFAFLKKVREGEGSQPYLLGLAYNFQHHAELPVEAWDVPVDGVWVVDVT